MSSKLTANGIFEGSRIILPEHREAYLNEMKEQERRGKPALDEQEMQLIEEAILESYQECRSVTLTVFNPFDDEIMRGVVTSIDKPNRRIKLVRADEDYSWIKIEEITAASR
ncbi:MULTISPECIES: YolD-like family protein [unclassified Paenibacillus]|uniref:YolD-like family protein n=1 Tax=unclassified Paenibacillus TaxID=185978 RepID=UPI0008C2B0A0|nr:MULTISPECIES: YolD-like family protein [unclassified Paenibacillus]QLG39965.1 YolD-like family protein [Paenibacillus sp. E222]SEN90804.1 YolD-like protein [Paenibacillus sp. OK076]